MHDKISEKQEKKPRLKPRKNVSLFTSYAVAHSKIVEPLKSQKILPII